MEACEMQNQGRQVVELLDKLQLSGELAVLKTCVEFEPLRVVV